MNAHFCRIVYIWFLLRYLKEEACSRCTWLKQLEPLKPHGVTKKSAVGVEVATKEQGPVSFVLEQCSVKKGWEKAELNLALDSYSSRRNCFEEQNAASTVTENTLVHIHTNESARFQVHVLMCFNNLT